MSQKKKKWFQMYGHSNTRVHKIVRDFTEVFFTGIFDASWETAKKENKKGYTLYMQQRNKWAKGASIGFHRFYFVFRTWWNCATFQLWTCERNKINTLIFL